MKKKEVIIGLVILLVLIGIIVGIKFLNDQQTGGVDVSKLTPVTVAVGGGKEDFLADEDVVSIIQKRYNLNVIYDSWSNGKMIKNALVREDGSKYDAMFPSDQRFYDYYKLSPDTSKGEAARSRVLDGSLTLNTPIVIYSWDAVVDAFIKEGIVTEKNGVYYITDMNKLLTYILEDKKWEELGLPEIYGTVNVEATDPVTSSPGATYYGLLLAILCEGNVTEEKLEANLPKLKAIYDKSGHMNNTPADNFEMYLRTGMGSYPLVVDYEKSIIEFANSNPDGWEAVENKIRILYPTPTSWNSHCIATFDDVGNEYLKVFDDKEIQQIAWSKYGFRTGITGGSYDVSQVSVSGIPQEITTTVPSLKMNVYDRLIEYLGE